MQWIRLYSVQFGIAILGLIICLGAYVSVRSPFIVTTVTVIVISLLYSIDIFQQNLADNQTKSVIQDMNFSYHEISIAIYALVSAVAVSIIRDFRNLSSINPYTDWELNEIPAYLFTQDSALLAIYNKTHIRQSALEIFLLFVALVIILTLFTRIFNNLLQNTETSNLRLAFHPATALCVLISLIAVVRFPPYNPDLFHWTVWIGPALDVMNGDWPIIHMASGYGFLSAGFMAIFINLFAVTPFTFYVLVASFTFLSALAVYSLISQISGSKPIALLMIIVLLFGFESPTLSFIYPNSGPLRFQLMTGLTMLLSWHILSNDNIRACFIGVIFGIVILYDPLFQGFAALPLGLLLLYQKLILQQKLALYRLITIIATSSTILVTIFLFSNGFPADGLSGIIYRLTGFAQLFYQGWASLPQSMILPELIWWGTGALSIGLLVYKIIARQVLSIHEQMLLFTVFYSIPIFLYHMNRTSWIGQNAVAWVMLPGAILIIWTIWHQKKLQFYVATITLATVLVLSQGVIPELGQRMNNLLFGYEVQRYEWASTCSSILFSGEVCAEEWPDPYQELRNEIERPVIDLESESNRLLISLCQQEIPFLSPVDSYIYIYGQCSSSFYFSPPASSNADIRGFNTYIEYILSNQIVALDWQIDNTLIPFWNAVEKRLVDNGYCTEQIEGTSITLYYEDCTLSLDSIPSLTSP